MRNAATKVLQLRNGPLREMLVYDFEKAETTVQYIRYTLSDGKADRGNDRHVFFRNKTNESDAALSEASACNSEKC